MIVDNTDLRTLRRHRFLLEREKAVLIGVPKEIKAEEYRVGMVPAAVAELIARGHRVLVQKGAGVAVGFDDQAYREAGAEVVDSAEEVFERAQLLVKVKEPQPAELPLLRSEHLLFTFLHLAPDPELARGLMASGASCIGYETVTDSQGRLPLLAPMSEVAGRLATQAGAHHLELPQGGRGVLLGGVPGVAPARVVIVGGGVVGTQAARVAMGMGASVTLLDKSLPRLRELEALYGGRLMCEYATGEALGRLLPDTDLLVGAVLVTGAATPKVLLEEQLQRMQAGAVLVDVSIDQGGCFESSLPTSHARPTYTQAGVVHYCVANIPSAVARTATIALNHATLPGLLALADLGLEAMQRDPGLRTGLNVHAGAITHPAVAEALGLEYRAPGDLLQT